MGYRARSSVVPLDRQQVQVTRRIRSVWAPDTKFVAAGILEVKASPAGKIIWFGNHFATGIADRSDTCFEVRRVEKYERTARNYFRLAAKAPNLNVGRCTNSPNADVLRSGAVVVEGPPKGTAIEVLGRREVDNAELDVVH